MAQILNPLAAHIRTVKKRLIIIGATILVALMVCFAFSGEMVAWLNRPFPNQLVFYGPTEALFASIKVSFLAAILASLPVIFYQCWKFIEPALLPKEQRWGIPLFALAGALFALGLSQYLFVMLRWARGFDLPLPAGLSGFFDRITERSSVRRALAEEGLA